MKITWFGQACLLLESSSGTRIICDPCSEEYGYRMPLEPANIVTVSHKHLDHCAVEIVQGDYELVDNVCDTVINDISIKGVKSYHDKLKGNLRGENIMYRFEFDNMSIVHAGDLGHHLTEEQIHQLRPCDILAVPVGGVFTLDSEDAFEVSRQLNPSVVIPIHYSTMSDRIGLNSEKKFVDKFLEIRRKKCFEGNRKNLPKNQTVFVLFAYGEKKK